MTSYAVVSPVKNEAAYVELTLRSVTSQTLSPALWVIVDDGSTDDSATIVADYASRYAYITLVRRPVVAGRQPGAGVIRAFNHGLCRLAGQPYDFIVKLDCDLSFACDYFARLLQRFLDDATLGIASGIYQEPDAVGTWTPVSMPWYHACGASKVVRRSCFEQIGGFVTSPGWDTVDEIRAFTRGWTTRHFSELLLRHHKPEGSGIGPLRTSRMHGEIFYRTGGDPLLLLFKVLHRLRSRPVVLNAAALIVGYLNALVRRDPLLVTRGEAKRYRALLRERLVARAGMSRAPTIPSLRP